jgi:6-phosphogluconolactonase
MTTQPDGLVIGSYTAPGEYGGGGAHGIQAAGWDPASGTVASVRPVASLANPSWVVVSTDGRTVYATLELSEFEGRAGGGVAAFSRDPGSGALAPLGHVPSGGSLPAHLAIDPSGRFIVAANYESGTVAVFAIEPDGSIGEQRGRAQHEGFGPDPERQEGPHAHQAVFDPITGRLLVVDLGLDAVLVYDFDEGRIDERPELRIWAPAGSGPRHLAFHPDGVHLFVLTELRNTLIVLRRDGDAFVRTDVVSTLPADFAGTSYCSELRIAPSGRHVYASNRGHDSIAVLGFDAEAGSATLLATEPTRGLWPRDFTVSPAGTHLLVANQNSDTVEVFAIEDDGAALRHVSSADVATPVCLAWAPA